MLLTASVRAAILSKHPEVERFLHLVGTVLRQPDEVRQSRVDERSVLYYRFEPAVLGGKWIVVVVKRADRKYVSTAYATGTVKFGAVLWPI